LCLSLLSLFGQSIEAKGKKVPLIELHAGPLYFSPNQDQRQDHVLLVPRFENVDSPSRWEIQFRDSSGLVKKTLSGSDYPPNNTRWYGGDDFGATAPEGSYDAALTLWDENNRPLQSVATRIVIDVTPPTVSMIAPKKKIYVKDDVVPPIPLELSAVDLSGISQWEITFQDIDKQVFYKETSTSALPSIWELTSEKANLPVGPLHVRLSIVDRAGNLTSQLISDIEIIHTVGSSKAKAAQDPVSNKPSSRKNMLQLTSIVSIENLFGKNADNHSSITNSADYLIAPIGQALNDSPGSKATIFGHVAVGENPQAEKALSSYFAWRVYSYMVRNLGVDKNIITVKGLGAEVPISENRTPIGRSRNRRVEIQVFFPREPQTQ